LPKIEKAVLFRLPVFIDRDFIADCLKSANPAWDRVCSSCYSCFRLLSACYFFVL